MTANVAGGTRQGVNWFVLARTGTVYAIDMAIAGLALFLAIELRIGVAGAEAILAENGELLPLYILVAGSVFVAMRLHRRVWRYTSTGDLGAVIQAVSISVIAYVAVVNLVGAASVLPRSVPIILWFVMIVLMGSTRLARRMLADFFAGRLVRPELVVAPRRIGRPALILGSADKVEQLLRHLEQDAEASFRPVGLLDCIGAYAGARIRGIPILGTADDLAGVVTALEARGERPECLIFAGAVERLRGAAMVRTVAAAQTLGLEIAYRPDFKAYAPEQGARLDFRYLDLADLLGRQQKKLDPTVVGDFIRGRRVLVTGAGGTIGRELVRQIAGFAPERIVMLDANEFNLYDVDLEMRENHPDVSRVPVLCSIRQRRRVMQVFAQHQPELVFHAAALKHVPLVEAHPSAAIHTNVIGTRNVADAACKCGAIAMVQVSTDKAVNPVGFMGLTKRLGELYCQALDRRGLRDPKSPRFMTVRFGNVLGSSGSLIPLFQRQLSRGGPLTVTHPEIERFFMSVNEAVQLILHSASCGIRDNVRRGHVFVLDMGQPVKVIDIARRMIRMAGLDPEIDIGIDIVGLRPGEKLFEELFDAEETQLPSTVPGVFEAEPRPLGLVALRAAFDALEEACLDGDDDACREIARKLLERRHDLAVDRVAGNDVAGSASADIVPVEARAV